MGKVDSLPKYRKPPPDDDVVDAICHDCTLDEVAEILVTLAHDLLRDFDEPSDRQHMTEILLRATMKTTWLSEEQVKEMDNEELYQVRELHEEIIKNHIKYFEGNPNLTDKGRETLKALKEQGSYDG